MGKLSKFSSLSNLYYLAKFSLESCEKVAFDVDFSVIALGKVKMYVNGKFMNEYMTHLIMLMEFIIW